ncbi:JAB domain-containing protein [Paenibacillus bovis]|uniref:DNA repair protein RadC n=1 Tax=Paenibacillus bovis TaxID=1616788 RepID=A0A1X9T461_9BACL|nr:JAB domain-containing protein [Paenibacillus bovis]ARR10765.1 DNA repair protein RadC [Paenibacillus bovis]
MTKISIVRVQLITTGTVDIGKRAVRQPSEAVRIIRTVLLKEYQGGMPDREVMGVLFLDTKNQVNGVEIASIGTLNSAPVHPRELFKAAILHNAAAVLMFHNHPSGNPEPSEPDIKVTQLMAEAGKTLGIELLDHLIIGEGERYTSLKEQGYF